MKKAVNFDMDGLIVDTEPLYMIALSKVAQARGKSYPLSLKQEMMGRRAIDSLRIFKERLGLSDSVEELLKERDEIFEDLLEKEKIKPMPGFFELLDNINKLSLKKAISSSSKREWIDIILKKLGIFSEFEVIISGDEVTHGKPHPEIYLLSLKRLNVSPKECIVFEDTVTGVESAKSAGLYCIAVPNQFSKGQDFSKADLVVDSLERIDMNLLCKIIAQ
jgi:HAD superfamily hydrolase (TIGR01509 family)